MKNISEFLIIISIIFFTLVSTSSFCQNIQDTSTQSLKPIPLAIDLNSTYAGSGDVLGFMVNFSYDYNFKKHLSLVSNLGFTFNPGQLIHRETIDNSTSEFKTEPIYSVIAGLQLAPLLAFNISANKPTGLKFEVGPVLRLQMNSFPSSFSFVTEGAITDYNHYIIYKTDRHHFNFGYMLKVVYDFKSSKKHFWGVNLFYQNDTNGDSFVGLGARYSHLFY